MMPKPIGIASRSSTHRKSWQSQQVRLNERLNVRPVKHPLITGRRNRERLLQFYGRWQQRA